MLWLLLGLWKISVWYLLGLGGSERKHWTLTPPLTTFPGNTRPSRTSVDKQSTELPAPNTFKSCKYSICLESSNNPVKQGWKYYTHFADEKTEGHGLLKYKVKQLVSVGPGLRTLVTHSTCSLSGTPEWSAAAPSSPHKCLPELTVERRSHPAGGSAGRGGGRRYHRREPGGWVWSKIWVIFRQGT